MFLASSKSAGIRIVFVLILLVEVFGVLPVQAASSLSFGWAKKMGGASYDRGQSLAVDQNGNVYSTGNFSTTVDFDPGAGTYNLTSAGHADTFIGMLDANGNFVWAKRIGGTEDDFGTGIAVDGSANVYSVGSFSGTADFDPGTSTYNLTSAGSYDIFISKLDANGNFLWAKAMGGISSDQVNGLSIDVTGTVYITGGFSGTVDFDPGVGISPLTSTGARDIFVAEYASNGGFVWAKSMSGTSVLGDSGNALAVDGNGNTYTLGDFTGTVDFDPGAGVYNLSSTGSNDIFISKLNTNGDFVWAKSIRGNNSDMGSDISVDEHGNVFSTGSFNGTADFDPGPGVYNLSSAGYWDNFVFKFDTDGNFVWAKAMGGTLTDNSYGLALDTSGSVYTTGGFANTVDFDPGPGTHLLTSSASVDIFISKLDTDGNFVWVKHMPGTYIQYGMNLVIDEIGNIYSIGDNLGTADFDPGVGTYNLSTSGYNDIFISKLTATAQIYYVQWDAGGTNNGLSWANAYTNLQSALSAASSGDEIWVAAGTYKPTNGTDRTISFTLRNGVSIYGGFAGTETLRTQRNPVTNVTVLSGDIGAAGNITDNSYHVVYSEGTATMTVLNGFTITAGNANGTSPHSNGGGLYNKNSSLKLQNLIFQGNTASVNGGGLYNTGSPSTLMNITFKANTANNSGGGIYNHQSETTLENITLDQNSAGYSGGGMSNYSSHPTLTNVTFHNNSAVTYGGGLSQSFSSPTLIHVTFSGNSASASNGGAITNDDSHPMIVNSILYGNVGGEIRNFTGSSPQVTYSIVQGGYAGTGNLNANPLLDSLQNNGGFTQTMALGAASPAIDAGTNTNCPSTDQRGVSRPQGSHCDMGAYESKGPIVITMAGTEIDAFSLAPSESKRVSFPGVNNGPVKIMNREDLSLIAAERLIYKVNNVATSFTEMMGLPSNQLDTTYWLPWYNNKDLDTQLRFANVSGSPASVRIYIGGVEMQGSPFPLAAGESTRKSFAGVNDGPVKIVSDHGVPIVAAERLIYKVSNVATSFSEVMALPNSQLDTTYWLPWYNNKDLDTQLRFANVSEATAQVHVYVGGDEMQGSPFTLQPGESTRKSFAGINDGPVKIVSDQNIVAAERLIYKVNNVATSFTEMMALPNSALDTTYWLPWYNNKDLDTQLRFANVHDTQTASVHVYVGGVEMQGSPFTLLPGESTRKSFPNINSGPVQIVCDVPIVAAERLIYKVNNIATSFSEMMALPDTQLDTTYWFPWYNNLDLDTQLRFGIP